MFGVIPAPLVIPAKAGIQAFICILWIPAFAGMTEEKSVTISRLLNFVSGYNLCHLAREELRRERQTCRRA